MNTGPYSNEQVQRYLEEHFVALKTQVFWDKPSELMERFNVTWTPTLLIHDRWGKAHHGVVGYVPEDDLIAHLAFGRARILFDSDHLNDAIELLKNIIETHPRSGVAPEAVYYLGVAEYKVSHDAAALRKIFDTLTAKYPESEWRRRSLPYEQIPAYAEA